MKYIDAQIPASKPIKPDAENKYMGTFLLILFFLALTAFFSGSEIKLSSVQTNLL